KDAIYATPRSLEIPIAFFAAKKGNVRFEVFNEKNKLVYSKSIDANFGMNQATYNLQYDDQKAALNKTAKKADDGHYYLDKGRYTIRFTQEGQTASKPLLIYVK
ncbi:MAG TPA: hypothetical protein PLU10_13145, partial [Chitinophagaceae bacterium]|nr:hypothetical protein [Chitinophagaceae bacterium]